MLERLLPILTSLWTGLDERLREFSKSLQRILAMLRLTRVLLWLGVVVILITGVLALLCALGYLDIKWFLLAYAVGTLFLLVPLAAFAVLVALPLKLRSVVRLIDQGYPENAREVVIRLLARKLHDQSIATEELLWDTAVNEGKKFVRKMNRQEEEPDAEAQGGDETGAAA